ncbi:MAG TPA: hypothetical protein VHZ07_11390 [Bryobacteraceae bacterium]|jgi:hypothetical protein|nr:hypothetical protein [Bryobacteraceae bacterium]
MVHHVEDDRRELQPHVGTGDPIELRIQQFKSETAGTAQLKVA